MVLDFGMNSLTPMNICQTARCSLWFYLCVVWCRSHCDFWMCAWWTILCVNCYNL